MTVAAGPPLPPPSSRRPDRDVLADRMARLHAASRRIGAPVYLGQGVHGPAWAAPQRSTLVLGPSRSGKTSSLVVPNVLAAPGPVVSTSTKSDVLEATARARATAGAVLLYDPSGTVVPPPGVERVGWSPVATAVDWDSALLTADAMVRTATATGGRTAVESHFTERAAALLGPLLHAAALADAPMSTVLRWVDRHDGPPALSLLAESAGEDSPATNLLGGILATDQREQSGIWSTASGALSAYRSAAALQSTTGPLLAADEFCAGSHTLYVCATGRTQQFLAPLVVGLLADVRDAAYRRAADGRADPPVLLALDEVANIAPLPDLPAVVSEGAGQGLLTLACLQDLSQGRARWGPHADAFVSLFGTTVVLPGIADVSTLRALSTLAGEVEVPVRGISAATTAGRRVQRSASVHTTWRPRLPPDVIGRGVPGAALAVDDRNQMGWVTLTPAHQSVPFCELLSRTRARPGRPDLVRPDLGRPDLGRPDFGPPAGGGRLEGRSR